MSDKIPVRVLLDRMQAHWPQAVSAETDIIFSVIRLHELIRLRAEAALKEFDLTHAAFEVLVALRAQPEPRQMTPTELYRSVLLSSGGTTKILIELERRGLIRRTPNPDDGRSKIVCLTQAGADMAERAMQKVMRHDKVHFARIDGETDLPALRDMFTDLMDKVEHNSET